MESFAEDVGGEYSKLGLENDGEYGCNFRISHKQTFFAILVNPSFFGSIAPAHGHLYLKLLKGK